MTKTMKSKLLRKCFQALILFGVSAVSAQQFQETDSQGEKVFYRIKSAAPEYEGRCLEDNIHNSRTSNYTYVLTPSSLDNVYQEWQLIPDAANEGAYYIKNKRSMRFIKNETQWVGALMNFSYASTKNSTKAFEFVPISEDEFLIRYTDSSGKQRYLSAATPEQTEKPKINVSRAQGTPYAWQVLNADGTKTGISIVGKPFVTVKSVDHKIVVTGTDDYQIFDLQGREITKQKNTALLPGTYLVSTNERTYKVLVK